MASGRKRGEMKKEEEEEVEGGEGGSSQSGVEFVSEKFRSFVVAPTAAVGRSECGRGKNCPFTQMK